MSYGTAPETPKQQPKTVFYLGVLRLKPDQKAEELAVDTDFSSMNFIARASTTSLASLTAKAIAEQTKVGERSTIVEKIGEINLYKTSFGICAIIVTELNYDRFAAQGVLTKTIDAFRSKFTPTEIKEKPAPFNWPELRKLRTDAILEDKASIAATRRELDETKFILHQTIEKVLERGEKLDTLVAKSDELGIMSKNFYKVSRQQNSCCVVM